MESLWTAECLAERVTCRDLLNACIRSISKQRSIVVPTGVLQNLQLKFFGPSKWITLQSCSEVSPQTLLAAAEALLSALPPLCASLLSTLENEAQDLKSKDTCITVLRDLNLSFDELWKLPSARAQALFAYGGMSDSDSQAVALAVYSKKRRLTSNTVDELSAVERAVRQLAVADERISFANCELSHERLEELCVSIVRDTQLKFLDLSANNIHHNGADVVARITAKLEKLEGLCLGGNNLLRDGIERVLTESAKLKQLRHLDISGCHGGPKLTQSLVTFLDGCVSLVHLNIASNDLANLSAFPSLPNLRTLDLSSNRLQGNDVASLKSSIRSPALAAINLHNNLIDDDGVAEVVLFASSIGSLRRIAVSFNPISDVGLLALAGLFDANIVSILADGTFSSADAKESLKRRNEAKAESLRKRLDEVRNIPMRQWLESDLELVSNMCIEDVATIVSLRGIDGSQLASSRTITFTQADWSRLSSFQEA